MAEFFKTSTIWVVDFRYKGSARRWFKAFRSDDAQVEQALRTELSDLYAKDAQLVQLRKATSEEEGQYLRGDLPVNSFCPTGR